MVNLANVSYKSTIKHKYKICRNIETVSTIVAIVYQNITVCWSRRGNRLQDSEKKTRDI